MIVIREGENNRCLCVASHRPTRPTSSRRPHTTTITRHVITSQGRRGRNEIEDRDHAIATGSHHVITDLDVTEDGGQGHDPNPELAHF